MPVHPADHDPLDLPVCGACGLHYLEEPGTQLIGLCPACGGFYRLGVERQLRAWTVPRIHQARGARRPGERMCPCCRHWYLPVRDESICGSCEDTVISGRELVADLVDLDLG